MALVQRSAELARPCRASAEPLNPEPHLPVRFRFAQPVRRSSSQVGSDAESATTTTQSIDSWYSIRRKAAGFVARRQTMPP